MQLCVRNLVNTAEFAREKILATAREPATREVNVKHVSKIDYDVTEACNLISYC